MRKTAIVIFALLLCLLFLTAAAEEGDSSFQQMMNLPTPAPTAEPQAPAEMGIPQQSTQQGGYQAPTAAPAPDIRYEADGSVVITITTVGDVTIGRNVQSNSRIFQKELDRQGGDINFIFRNVRHIFAEDDLTIVNFEGVLADDYSIPSGKRDNSFLFLAPTAYASVLPNNGVEVATIENNHIDDFGDSGRASTRQALSDAGILWADENNMAVYETQGVKIAVLAYKTFNYHWRELKTTVPRDVAAAKETCDLVIVAYHWGTEEGASTGGKAYYPDSNSQVDLGHITIDAGADLVIGHHSHRVNPIEQYNGKYIVYSLGNFSFAGNSKPSDMSTFIFQTRFRIKEGEIIANPFRIIPCRISSKSNENDFTPTPYESELHISNVINTMLKNSKGLTHAVSVYPLDWE